MDSIRVTAKTVKDAITEASIQLGTSSDNIEYTVIEEGSRGFLGIGSRKAVIEAKKKFTDEDLMNEVFGDLNAKPKKEAKKENQPKKEAEVKKENRETLKEVRKEPKKESPKAKEESAEKKEAKDTRREGRREYKKPTFEERKAAMKAHEKQENVPAASGAEKSAANAEPKTVEQPNVSAEAQPKADVASAVSEEPKTPRVPADPEEAKRRANVFLTEMFRVMGMQVEIRTSFEEDTLSVDLTGEEMGLLIGKRGQTLDSLQYLTSLVVNKGKASYVRVKLDTEDYRSRRKATLENLAKNIAFKVKKTRRPVFLEPMNPYERRIIHSALQNDPYVTTHSEGEEPCRKVVVTPKRRDFRPARGEYQKREYRSPRPAAERTAKEESEA